MRGVSLIELLIALAVLSILSLIAIPNYTRFLQQQRIRVVQNNLYADLMYARSIAVTRQRTVRLCGSTDGLTCHNHYSWQGGWIVFIEMGSDIEVVLVRQDEHPGVVFGYNNRFVRIAPRGTTFQSGSFILCPENLDPDAARRMVVNWALRPRVVTTAQSAGSITAADCEKVNPAL